MLPPARKPTIPVRVGHVTVGGDHPIVIQSMTNTDTADAEKTAQQVAELHRAGSELVRITVNNKAAAAAVPEIRSRLHDLGVDVPLIGDFHYNGHVLLREFEACAEALDKYRINPGNVGKGDNRDDNFATMIRVAIDHDRPVRIGVNAGSLDQELLAQRMDDNAHRESPLAAEEIWLQTMVESGVRSADAARELGLAADKIIISCKVSRVQELAKVYERLSESTDHALHLGLTEAGMGRKGLVTSTAGLAVLLQQGIGDTIRVSLTPEPGSSRTEEVRAAQAIVQAMGIRPFLPTVTACPGCGRTTSEYFLELSREIENYLTDRMPAWRETNPRAAELRVAVMGCVVNGPGRKQGGPMSESACREPAKRRGSPVYVDGEQVATLEGPTLAADFKKMIEDYVRRM